MTARMRGTTLVELLIVLALLVLVTQASIPSFMRAFETRRVDEAQAVLLSIWNAQRMHWIEHRAYADDLTRLVELRLLDDAVLHGDGPFTFGILHANARGFSARAQRAGSSQWTGALTVNARRKVEGFVMSRNGEYIGAAPV